MLRECQSPPTNSTRPWQFLGFRTDLADESAGRSMPAERNQASSFSRFSANQADELQPIRDRHIDVHEGQVEIVTGDLPEAVHTIPRPQGKCPSVKQPHPWAESTAPIPRVGARPRLRSQGHREFSGAPIMSACHSFFSTSLGGDAIELVHNEVRLRTNLFADALAKKCAGFLNF